MHAAVYNCIYVCCFLFKLHTRLSISATQKKLCAPVVCATTRIAFHFVQKERKTPFISQFYLASLVEINCIFFLDFLNTKIRQCNL